MTTKGFCSTVNNQREREGTQLKSRKGPRDEWRTPRWLFERAQRVFGLFHLDAAASKQNALCPRYYTREDDGLSQEWIDGTWCNPPYSNINPWVDHAIEQKVQSTLLLPSLNGDSRDFKILRYCNEIAFLPRISFINPGTGLPQKGNPRGSILVNFPSSSKQPRRPVDIKLQNSLFNARSGGRGRLLWFERWICICT